MAPNSNFKLWSFKEGKIGLEWKLLKSRIRGDNIDTIWRSSTIFPYIPKIPFISLTTPFGLLHAHTHLTHSLGRIWQPIYIPKHLINSSKHSYKYLLASLLTLPLYFHLLHLPFSLNFPKTLTTLPFRESDLPWLPWPHFSSSPPPPCKARPPSSLSPKDHNVLVEDLALASCNCVCNF